LNFIFPGQDPVPKRVYKLQGFKSHIIPKREAKNTPYTPHDKRNPALKIVTVPCQRMISSVNTVLEIMKKTGMTAGHLP
jgi:hypothetical protein